MTYSYTEKRENKKEFWKTFKKVMDLPNLIEDPTGFLFRISSIRMLSLERKRKGKGFEEVFQIFISYNECFR